MNATPDDLDFMPETHAAEIEAVPVSLHLILWLTAGFLIVALVWAGYATLDEVARAEGRVIPSSQIQIVQNLEGGILAEVMTREGASISAGQSLMRLDDTRFASSFNESRLAYLAMDARAARLEAEIAGEPFTAPEGFPAEHASLIEDERDLFRRRAEEMGSAIDILNQQLTQQRQGLAELRAETAKLEVSARLAQEEFRITEPLVETGAVSQVELLRLEGAVNESSGRLEVSRLAIPKAEALIAEAERKIIERGEQFRREAQVELNEARTQRSRLAISGVALEDRVNRTDVQSPVDGTVKQILVNTVGAVIQPGMDLLEIVPANDTLLVEAKVRPADIAFLRPGQQATVKLTAYDFSIYGGLDSELELISADTITDERGEHFFKIRVRTQRNYLGTEENPLPIIPGMIATVDIMTGQKTVLDYILKPLKRAQANALSER